MRVEGPKASRRVRNTSRFAYLTPMVVESPRGLKASDLIAKKLSKCFADFDDNTGNSGLMGIVAGQMNVKIKAGITPSIWCASKIWPRFVLRLVRRLPATNAGSKVACRKGLLTRKRRKEW